MSVRFSFVTSRVQVLLAMKLPLWGKTIPLIFFTFFFTSEGAAEFKRDSPFLRGTRVEPSCVPGVFAALHATSET